MFTPEGTPEPDTGRNETDENGRRENASQGTGDRGGGFVTTKDRHPDVDGDDASKRADPQVIKQYLSKSAEV